MPGVTAFPGRLAWTSVWPGLTASDSAVVLVRIASLCLSVYLHLGARYASSFSLRPADGIRMEIPVAAGNCEPDHYCTRGRTTSMSLHLILFSVFGLVCVAGAVNLLVQRHPINSALSLVVAMGSPAVEDLLLGAQIVAAVPVLVFAGACSGQC